MLTRAELAVLERASDAASWRVVRSIGIVTLINDHDEVLGGVEHDLAQSLGEQLLRSTR
jgi:hypothetical protein